jgi:hypothetical protein
MYASQLVTSPVELKGIARRAQWEEIRRAELFYMLCDGKITMAQAKERGLWN